MKTFKDNEKRQWSVTIDVAAIKRVRELAGVDLMTILDGTLTERLASDPVLLVDVIYAACKPAVDERKITDAEFGAALVGDAIADATDALLESVVDFFPSGRRQTLLKLLSKGKEIQQAAQKVVGEKLDQIDPAELVRKMLGGSSGSSPASAESTPAL